MTNRSLAAGSASPTRGTIITFTSTASGVGRTSAVANVAWILAAAGKRVLIADWSTESASAHEFLSPFQVDTAPFSEPIRDSVLSLLTAGWGRESHHFGHLAGRGVNCYELPSKLGSIDLVSHAGSDTESRDATAPSQRLVPPMPNDPDLLDRLRAALHKVYDYVLVDGTTAPSEGGLTGIAAISDLVVSFFTLRQRSISDAAATVQKIAERARPAIRFVAVPTKVDDRDPRRVERSRQALREEFAGFVDADHIAELPYHPEDAYDERLAVLIDGPHDDQTLLRAYERLTGVISDGEVTKLEPMPPAVRTRYRRAFGLDGPAAAETIFVGYATKDRPWVDWLGAMLAPAGVEVERLPAGPVPDGHTVLAVQSENPIDSATRRRLRALAEPAASTEATEPAAGGGDLVIVQVADVPQERSIAVAPAIDLRESGATASRARLLTHLGLIAPPYAPEPMSPRFPGASELPPKISNIPPVNVSFVGRDEELDAIRDALLADADAGADAGAAPAPYVLSGSPGVGKTELAREYAHRFALDYDVIWWIGATSELAVRAALTRLGTRLGVPESGDVAAAALAALASESRNPRFLLIYDNVDDLSAIASLLPRAGVGHVIVTSRTADTAATSDVTSDAAVEPRAMNVDVFADHESFTLLRRHVPSISWDDARAVAGAVENLPFSLRLAGSWVSETAAWLRDHGSTTSEALTWATVEFCARIERTAGPAGRDGERKYPRSAAACVAATFSSLHGEPLGRLTVRLLELCAFLSPQGVALWLLHSRAMLDQLVRTTGDDGTALHRDSLVLDKVLWISVKYGLAEIDWGGEKRLRMHRMLQDIIHDRMSATTRAARRDEVLQALAWNAPTEAAGIEESGHVLGELQRHILSSGALDSDDPHVRHWVLRQVWYRYATGDINTYRETLDIGRPLLDRWTTRFGHDDELRMRLVQHVANLQRELGNVDEALEMHEELLGRQRRTLGPTHPRTLASGRSRAADLRGLGRFGDAYTEEESTWAGYQEAFGDDHLQTLLAANNLAHSALFAGDQRAALNYGQDVSARRERLFGPDDPLLLAISCNVGLYLRELGYYRQAWDLLSDTRQRLSLRHPHRLRDLLRATKNLAVTERRLGNKEKAEAYSAEALKGNTESFGDDHPDSLSCRLSLAADQHALGRAGRAVELGDECLAGYVRTVGEDHPFTHLCRVNLAVFALGAGDVRRALSLSESGLAGLLDRLGDQHPWALAAAIDRACCLAADDDHEAAIELDETTAEDCLEYLGPKHPYTILAHDNWDSARKAARAGFQYAGDFRRGDVDIDVPYT